MSISNYRDHIIHNKLYATDLQKSTDDLTGMVELLQLNTKAENNTFLQQFNSLKLKHSIIRTLCDRRTGLLKNVGFRLKQLCYGKTKVEANRYKAIVNQLKYGKNLNSKSYFGLENEKTICEKVDELITDYYTKRYSSDENRLQDKDNLTQLENFNCNLGYTRPSTFNYTQTIDIMLALPDTNKLWNEFIKLCPQYLCLDSGKLNDDKAVNVKGKSYSDVHNKLCDLLRITNTSENTLWIKDTQKDTRQLMPLFQKNLGIYLKEYIEKSKIEATAVGNLARKPVDTTTKFFQIKDTQNNVLGWSDGKVILQHPVKITKPREKNAGGFKKLTHEGRKTVGLTAYDSNKGPLPAIPNNVKQALIDMGIKTIIPQHRVNREFFVAPNLGPTLYSLLCHDLYVFDLNHFKPLLDDLAKIHLNGIAHRDIKPDNVYFRDGKVVLSDLDTMNYKNEFTAYAWTPGYATNQLYKNPRLYADRADSYGMLMTLFECYFKKTFQTLRQVKKYPLYQNL